MKNKKAVGFMTLGSILLIVLFLLIMLSIFGDKYFYDDVIDAVKNIFQPPEVDPSPSRSDRLIRRQDAIDYTTAWIDLINSMKESERRFCYETIPLTTTEFREENFSLEFVTTDKNKFEMRLMQDTYMTTRPYEINMGLCIIGEHNDGDVEILDNFKNAFLDNSEGKGTRIDDCFSNNNCALFFSDSSLIKEEYADPQDFLAKIIINSPEEKNSRESFGLEYSIQKKDGNHESIFDVGMRTTQKLDYILFKLDNNICFLPLGKTSLNFFSDTRRSDNLKIFKRNEFYDGVGEPKEDFAAINKCSQEESVQEQQYDIEPGSEHIGSIPK